MSRSNEKRCTGYVIENIDYHRKQRFFLRSPWIFGAKKLDFTATKCSVFLYCLDVPRAGKLRQKKLKLDVERERKRRRGKGEGEKDREKERDSSKECFV